MRQSSAPKSFEEKTMAYLVLARKWRPTGFEAITGQEHVTRTLRNAIAQDRVHHAFLFCGARGVGKTSAARVLAKALNCHAFDGPTAEACGVCSACKEIAAGTSVDVFEIDGASNRGIGEIRELRDGVAYAPQRDRFKIYIIDEVHMLTTEAFNALLKTLEEPPAHVKFIFATTEPHKIPVTILSRCQRFDFKRIPMPIMVQRLSEILTAEGVRLDDAALRLVARESEGSMRDALSLLDRIISACGAEADFAAVANVLGVADRAWLNKLVLAALERNPASGLEVVAEVFNYGIDLRKFVSDLVHHLRDLAMIQVVGDDAPTELSTDEQQALKAIGERFTPEDVQRLVRMTAETAERLVQASFPRLELEMLVIRMGRMHPVQPLESLLRRLTQLERHLTSGEPLPPPRPSADASEGASHPKAEAQAKDLGRPILAKTSTLSAVAPVSVPPVQPSSPPPVNVAPPAPPPAAPPPAAPPAAPAPPPAAPPAATAPIPPPAAPPAASAPMPSPAAPPAASAPMPSPAPPAPAPAAPPAAPAPPPAAPPAATAPTPPPAAPPAPAPELGAPPPVRPPEPTSAVTLTAPAPGEFSDDDMFEDSEDDSEPMFVPTFNPDFGPSEGPPAAANLDAPSDDADFVIESTRASPHGRRKPLSAIIHTPLEPESWSTLVHALRATEPSLAGALSHLAVRGFTDGTLELDVAGVVTHKRVAASLDDITLLVSELCPLVTTIALHKVEEVSESPHQRRVEALRAKRERLRTELETHPLIVALQDRLGGVLGAVELAETEERSLG